MNSIIVGTEIFTDPKAAIHRIAELNNISVNQATRSLINEAQPSPDLIVKLALLATDGKMITLLDYLQMFLEDTNEDFLFTGLKVQSL